MPPSNSHRKRARSRPHSHSDERTPIARAAPSHPDRPRRRVGAANALAEREHALDALIDLNQGLAITLDLYSSVNFLLLNLMGQLGTSRAALWLLTDGEAPILIRSHGIGHELARALMKVCGARLVQRLCEDSTPIVAGEMEDAFGASKAALLRKEGIAILAPLRARGSTLGFVALGPRVDGAGFKPLDIQVLEAALGIAGIAIQNGETYNRLHESRRQLLIANEELKQLDRMKSEFIRNVNHELRTPLSVIVPALECAMEMKPDAAELRTLHESSMHQARRLTGIVETLLTLSEMSRDALTLRVDEREVAPTLVRFHAERLPGMSADRRELVLVLPLHLPPARFDEHRICQILNALVDNAVKFSRPGSRIVLRADEVLRDGDRWVRIEVEDDGPGIPADQLTTVFAAFRQLDGSTTRSVGGMGIGLALAHDLAEKMGGRLIVASDSVRGSTFTLLLRAATAVGANDLVTLDPGSVA